MFEALAEGSRWDPPRVEPDFEPGSEPVEWDGIPAGARIECELFAPYEPPDPDEAVCAARYLPLGPNTIPLLTAVPFDQLSAAARSQALQLLTEFGGYLESLKAEVTAAIAGPAPRDEEARKDDFSSCEVAVATNSSAYGADAQIAFARDLRGRLAATWGALRGGTITAAQARRLSEETRHLDDEIAKQIEAKLLKYSARQSLSHFTRSLRRWLAKLDPDWTARSDSIRRQVIVEHNVRSDGTGEVYIRGPLEDTMSINLAMSNYAEQTKDELGGTVEQRKFACLRDWAEAALGAPGAPTRHGRAPTVNVSIDLATLLGLRKGVAEIPGVGSIPASAARWLLADGAPLRRLVIDPIGGRLLDYGTTTYLVPPPLADYLIAKNITSACPHSTVRADGCDMEHNVPHDRGGATNPLNTTPVERRWHRAKTHGGWTYAKDPDTDVVTWTSPNSGLTCEIHPYDYRAGP